MFERSLAFGMVVLLCGGVNAADGAVRMSFESRYQCGVAKSRSYGGFPITQLDRQQLINDETEKAASFFSERNADDKNMSSVCCPMDVSLLPIAVDFVFFIGSKYSENPMYWPSALADISENIRYLLCSGSFSELETSGDAMCGLAGHAFEKFALFCSSHYCGLKSSNRVCTLLLLIRKRINMYPVGGESQRSIDEFNDFVSNITADSVSKIHDRKHLFLQISELLEPRAEH